MKSVILGTAGHIDHGKSSLVKALTGVDPDRLKEEKERGITIELGFANLLYPDGLSVGIVDVPGHERLIKNMLAGAGGLDIVLMVIAADEGIMPQSREHLAICELLKTKAGLIAVTKSDLVDGEWLTMVMNDIRVFVRGTFLADAEIVAVSAKTGAGLDTLKDKIRDVALMVQPKLTEGLFRLPIDRVFTLKGFGTVVTGTALAGAITLDSHVEILPSKISSKVRGLQSHGRAVDKAYAGQRIGINLQGVDRELLKRGDVVVPPDRFTPTKSIDARVDMLRTAPELKSRSRVHFYAGTSETIARIVLYDRDALGPGESCYCQFRLEDPVVALSGDRYIIRRFSPLETIGGGEILDPQPVKRKRGAGTEDLVIFEKGPLQDRTATKIRRSGFNGLTLSMLEGWLSGNLSAIHAATDHLLKNGTVVKSSDVLFHKDVINAFREEVCSRLSSFHKANPLKAGMPKEEAKTTIKMEPRIFNSLVELLDDVVVEKEVLRLKTFTVALSSGNEGDKKKILEALGKEGLQPPSKQELGQALALGDKELADLLRLLTREGALVRINDSMYITALQYEKMLDLLKGFFTNKRDMTVAEFRDILGTTRKYALPFLEFLDSHRVTLRVGDTRRLMVK
jgi:selenocysteine-specific elongation factor